MNQLQLIWKDQHIIFRMGLCMSSTAKHIQDKAQPYDQPLNDFPDNASTQMQRAFHCLFSKLKLKHCNNYQQLKVRVDFAKLDYLELKDKFLIKGAARWEIEHFLEFKESERFLRQNFLELSVHSIEGKELGRLKINFFLLAVGPYHQDFAVPLPQAQSARVCFNFKISQLIHLDIAFQEVEMIPKDHQFPGDTFTFALRAILGDKSDETDTSQKFIVGFDEMEKEKTKQNQNKAPEGELRASQNGNKKQTIIYWSGKQKKMLSTEAYVPYYELEQASFNIIFYRLKQGHKQFYSQCYISYNKIIQNQSHNQSDAAAGFDWLVRNPNLELEAWDHGKLAGKARFRFIFRIQSHIKQVKLCVRTQLGILEGCPNFDESHGDSNFPPELEELHTLTLEVQTLFMDASKYNFQTKKQQDQWKSSVTKRLQRQEEILLSSAKESKMMFMYPDRRALLKGQRGLIELGFRVKDMLTESQGDISAICWRLLSSLIKRSELSLSRMGFSQEQLLQKNSEEIKAKRGVAVSYYALLVYLLQITLQSFDGYQFDSQRNFAQDFCAYAYFIIPTFRNKILEAIIRPSDPQLMGENSSISEWVDFMSMKQIKLEGRNSFSRMFDWEGSFINPISTEDAFLVAQKRLGELLKGGVWQERMRRRGGAFFAFVRYWVGYVQSTTANILHVNWKYFPGYSKILHAFLAELEQRKPEECPPAMCQAASALLANQKLLSPLVVILFKKTNANNQIGVAKTMQVIHFLFKSISKHCEQLPASFDIKYFLKGLKMILEGESSYAISKSLLLLYDHFLLFPEDFRVQIGLYLMSRVFFKLFLHWCSNVRNLFHHIFLIRLYHHTSLPLDDLPPKDQDLHRAHPQYRTEIIMRYKKLLMVVQNAADMEHKLHRHKVDVFQKEMFKKMRNRINQRRRQSSSHISSEDNQSVLMSQLMQPRQDSYTSEELSKTLSNLLDRAKESRGSEISIRSKSNSRGSEQRNHHGRKRISYFDSRFQTELVPIKQSEIIYVKIALEEYKKVNENFIEHLQRNNQTVPSVSVELSLDEKQLRPQGQFKSEEW